MELRESNTVARPRVRGRLLDAAYELLCEGGVSLLTTRGVAAKAGTTEASVFNNFGDKNGLLKALIAERLPQVIAVHNEVNRPDTSDLTSWVSDVLSAAEDFYIVVVPLSAPIWATGHRLLSDENERESLFPLHATLTLRLRVLQHSGVVSEGFQAESTATLLLGAALHNALNYIALFGGEGRYMAEDDLAVIHNDPVRSLHKRALVESLVRLIRAE